MEVLINITWILLHILVIVTILLIIGLAVLLAIYGIKIWLDNIRGK